MPRNKKYVYICSPKRKVFPCGIYWRDAGVVDRAALEMRCTGNCTGGSNPSLSAIKGVNQAFARFTPFFTPKNAIRTKLGSGNIPFIGYFVITTLIQTKYPQKISTNNYNKN